jgi:hypothetical protein
VKRVWSGGSLPDTTHFKNVLEHEGIACLIKNCELGGGVGDLPVFDAAPELWILDDDHEARAVRLLRDSSRPAVHGALWRCARCGEDNEAQFAVCWNCGSADQRPAEPG